MRCLFEYAEFQWLIQVHSYKYLQDHRGPFSSCKPNEELPHIALNCCNENQKELFVDILTIARLMSSWNL